MNNIIGILIGVLVGSVIAKILWHLVDFNTVISHLPKRSKNCRSNFEEYFFSDEQMKARRDHFWGGEGPIWYPVNDIPKELLPKLREIFIEDTVCLDGIIGLIMELQRKGFKFIGIHSKPEGCSDEDWAPVRSSLVDSLVFSNGRVEKGYLGDTLLSLYWLGYATGYFYQNGCRNMETRFDKGFLHEALDGVINEDASRVFFRGVNSGVDYWFSMWVWF